jgi:hypothetical protein
MSDELTKDDCVIDSFFGSTHPYNFCIKPASKIFIPSEQRSDNECNTWGFNCIGDNMLGFGKYLSSLKSNPKNILDPACQDNYSGDSPENKLGNKYVIKTSTKCKTNNGKIVDRYIYINNTNNNEIFGIPMLSEDSGILPASLSKATRINGSGFFYSLIQDGVPECSKVKVKCHLLDKYKKKYSGPSPSVNIAKSEIDSIRKNDNLVEVVEEFSNLNNNNINNNIINDAYYLLIGILILYVIFKMIHKK